MNHIVCVQDVEDYAYKVLPKNVLQFYCGGAGSEETLKNERKTFSRLRIRPRVLRNVAQRDLTTLVLQQKMSMPIGISPTGMMKMAHPDGECAAARVAQKMGTIFILSTVSTSSIEEIATAAPLATKWFQLYVYNERKITRQLVQRAENAGFKALVLTVDVPLLGKRRAAIRNSFSLPPHIKLANFVGHKTTDDILNTSGANIPMYVRKLFDPSLEWHDIKWLQSITKLPIILKGILTAEDAIIASNLNIAGIIVSTHGGRQLDTVPSSIEALPEIVKAVGDKVEVYVDGGVREGIDVFKAIALGAKMVFIGRPVIWGLAYAGEEGVLQVLKILREELDETLALTGCNCLRSITKDMVVHENYYCHL